VAEACDRTLADGAGKRTRIVDQAGTAAPIPWRR
jgi:hypothetical protein